MTADYMPSGELRLDDRNGVRHSCRTLGEGGTHPDWLGENPPREMMPTGLCDWNEVREELSDVEGANLYFSEALQLWEFAGAQSAGKRSPIPGLPLRPAQKQSRSFRQPPATRHPLSRES